MIFMKLILVMSLLAVMLLMTGCDPGMTVYQTKSATSQPGSADQRVTVSVKTIRPFIGETWYAPNLIVSNGSNRSIVVTKVELLAGDMTYLSKPPVSSNKYPLTIVAAKSEQLPVWFDLKADVQQTFEKAAEMRVYYRSDREDFAASAFILGGPLDMKTP